jgi:hypothetical protein
VSGPGRVPGWATERLIACLDGPLAHMWFTDADWTARVEAARYLHTERGQRRGPVLDYVVDAVADRPHPQHPQILGHAARYRPQRARVQVSGDWWHGQVPAGAVYVGRAAPGLPASRYANPHRVGPTCRACGCGHDPAGAVAAYAAHLDARPELVASARAELAGHDLACWCRDGPCHADLLALVVAGDDPPAAAVRVAATRHPTPATPCAPTVSAATRTGRARHLTAVPTTEGEPTP